MQNKIAQEYAKKYNFAQKYAMHLNMQKIKIVHENKQIKFKIKI